MRALVYRDADLVLDRDYPIPVPVEGEALIRVTHASICNTDLEIIRGYMAFQGVLGHEFVGVVEALQRGPGATPLTSLVGKRVVGEITPPVIVLTALPASAACPPIVPIAPRSVLSTAMERSLITWCYPREICTSCRIT